MQSDILFDNIYIGHSIEDAEKLKAETYGLKRPVEEALEEASKPKQDQHDSLTGLDFKEDPVSYVRSKVDLFLSILKEDPVEAVKVVPEVAGGLGAIFVTLILVIVGAIGLSSPAPAPAKKDAGKAKEEVSNDKAEAVSTGADKGTGATKRTTKS